MPETSRSPATPAATAPDGRLARRLSLGTIGVVVFSDIVCPWAHIAVSRLLRTLHERGLDGEINVDHRAFPLEVIGDEGPDRDRFDRSVEALREIEPDAGWSTWRGEDSFPSSSLLALEAVQAAKAVSTSASVALDRALRRAFFADSRPIDDIDTVLAVFRETVDPEDVRAFEAELQSGRARGELDEQTECAGSDQIPASPTIVLPDGSAFVNPGIEFHVGDDGVPVVERDHPEVYGQLLDAYLGQRTYD